MRTLQKVKQDILLKEQRVAYWEKYHTLPGINIKWR